MRSNGLARTRRPVLVVAAAYAMAGSPDSSTAPAPKSPALDQGGLNAVPTAVSASHAALFPNDVLATINGVNVYNGGFGSAVDQLHGSNEFYSLTDRAWPAAGPTSSLPFPISILRSGGSGWSTGS